MEATKVKSNMEYQDCGKVLNFFWNRQFWQFAAFTFLLTYRLLIPANILNEITEIFKLAATIIVQAIQSSFNILYSVIL